MDTKDNRFEKEILPFMSPEVRSVAGRLNRKVLQTLEEIRMRAGKPLMVQDGEGDWFVDGSGVLTQEREAGFPVSQAEIIRTLELMSENSVYAFQEEIRNGFITLKGGHRIGITGKVVQEGSSVKNIKDISGLNIRISKEIPGCGEKMLPFILSRDKTVFNTLIISPPGCGKTTLLRDIARILSDGKRESGFRGVKVGIVDERSEIAACYKGVGQNRTGIRTDVLDGCPKAIGMSMMIRSMSPHVIITDEIGNQGDKEAIIRLLNAGIKIITSAHGYSVSELKSRQEVFGLIDAGVFDRYIVLSKAMGPGTMEEVLDGDGLKPIYRRECHAV